MIDNLLLKDKTVLITGSSRGIGAATARLAKQYGASVILHGQTESQELKNIAKELNFPYVFCDVRDADSVKERISKIGKIEVLVNSAGINISKPFMELEEDDWIDVFSVNVLGTVNFSKAVIPSMLKNKYGKIINLASIKGFPQTSGRAAYACSKASIITLTVSMAKEFAPYILVNAVAPGFTDTGMTKKTMSPRIMEQINQIPLKRIAKPEEIAELILFLASDKSNYITGQTIIADGGYSLR